jgi:hypothetical protein
LQIHKERISICEKLGKKNREGKEGKKRQKKAERKKKTNRGRGASSDSVEYSSRKMANPDE